MTATFDVITQEWIPVADLNGTLRKVGLEEALKSAHRFAGISDPSPMVEYGLYRLLAVFLMDALRPESRETLEDYLEEGAFDEKRIDDYIAQCRSEGVSFDLFDPERPFLQTPFDKNLDKKTKESRIKTVAVLDYTCPSGNNHIHFDHRNGKEHALLFDEAARLLVPLQIFCPAGGRGYPYNVNGQPPYYTVVKGRTLFETLVFSLRPLDKINIPFDTPPVFWRNFLPVESGKSVAETSWLYGMIFPARQITLLPDENVVREVYIAGGMKYATEGGWTDPYVTYRVVNGELKPWCPNREIAVWRNLNDLINVDGKKAPEVLQQFFALEKESDEASISVYGVHTEAGKATFYDYFQFDLKIPANLVRGEMLLEFVTCAIRAAENMERTLVGTFYDLPEYKDAPYQKPSKENPHPMIYGIPKEACKKASRQFYDSCEQPFWRICRNTGDTVEELGKQYFAWCDFLKDTAQKVQKDILRQMLLTMRSLAKVAAHEEDILTIDKRNREEWGKCTK